MYGIPIRLTAEEQANAIEFGKRRHACNLNTPDRRRSEESGESIHIEGMGAEIGFCRLVEAAPDFSIGSRSGGIDTTLLTGQTVDVKQTRYQSGHLLVAPWKTDGREAPEMYALMTGTLPTYTFRGWAWAEFVCDKKWLADLGRGMNYTLGQGDLIHELPLSYELLTVCNA